jgi:excisionase family DNA binding protein
METYLTIEGLAEYLKLAEQTIRRWVHNDEVPYHKIKKVIRFRVSEIEKWVDGGGKVALETLGETSKNTLTEGEETAKMDGIGDLEGGSA